ncbi:MAG: glycosyltransferase family 4 protein [Pseudomonadota bacterium]
MSKSILFEASNLGLATGTGIATYARTLASAAGRLGFTPLGLLDVARPLDRRQPALTEILAFDAVAPNEPVPPLAAAWRALSRPFATLGGVHALQIPQTGVVVDQATAGLRAFERVYAATRLLETARGHFKLFGRSLSLKLPQLPSLFHATHPVPLTVKGVPNIVTIHDLVPLRLPFTTLDDKRYFYKLAHHLARTADHIVTVSEHSRRDIIQVLGVDERRVTNTWQAVDVPTDIVELAEDALADRLQRLFGLEPDGYFLFCGAIEPKKNISRLLDAYAASGTTRPLIMVGSPGWQNKEEMRKIGADRFRSFRIEGRMIRRERQVRRLEYLARDQLFLMMRGARALLFPSIYEGFGLPVAEAMRLGTPVLTSNISSLPEVAGDNALVIDPYSIEAIARGIAALDADDQLCADLAMRGRSQAARFSSTLYAQRVKKLYDEVI